MNHTYIVEGKQRVHGSVVVGGSEVLSYIAIILSILSDGPITVKNVPDSTIIRQLLDTLQFLGSHVERSKKNVVVDSSQVTTKVIPREQTNGSVLEALLVTVLGVRFGRAAIQLDSSSTTAEMGAHLQLIEDMFEKDVHVQDGYTTVEGKVVDESYAITVTLPLVLIHALLASVLGTGTYSIRNVERSYTVDVVMQFLKQLGVEIQQDGTSLIVNQVDTLSGGTLTVPGDMYEMFFWVTAALITNGEVTIEHIAQQQTLPFLSKLEQMGASFSVNEDALVIWNETGALDSVNIDTKRINGSDTRLARNFIILATNAQGESQITHDSAVDTLIGSEFLKQFGVEFTETVEHDVTTLHIFGPTVVTTESVVVDDSAFIEIALLLSMNADNTTTITIPSDMFALYDSFDEKLKALGLDVKEV